MTFSFLKYSGAHYENARNIQAKRCSHDSDVYYSDPQCIPKVILNTNSNINTERTNSDFLSPTNRLCSSMQQMKLVLTGPESCFKPVCNPSKLALTRRFQVIHVFTWNKLLLTAMQDSPPSALSGWGRPALIHEKNLRIF